MNNEIHMTLWCKRNNQVFEFTASIGVPTQREDGDWECLWSLGKMLNHEGHALRSINSMLAMLTSIKFVAVFLKGRSEQGDLFYLDESLEEPIDDITQLFSELSFNNIAPHTK